MISDNFMFVTKIISWLSDAHRIMSKFLTMNLVRQLLPPSAVLANVKLSLSHSAVYQYQTLCASYIYFSIHYLHNFAHALYSLSEIIGKCLFTLSSGLISSKKTFYPVCRFPTDLLQSSPLNLHKNLHLYIICIIIIYMAFSSIKL